MTSDSKHATAHDDEGDQAEGHDVVNPQSPPVATAHDDEGDETEGHYRPMG
jgi:hypothetical protein